MTVLETEQLITCDIDETLISWEQPAGNRITFRCPYTGDLLYVTPMYANIKVLTNHLARGTKVLVWSRSGYKWAVAALQALRIDHDNIIVASKPIGYIDDKPCQEWMGEQVYLPIDKKWGIG